MNTMVHKVTVARIWTLSLILFSVPFGIIPFTIVSTLTGCMKSKEGDSKNQGPSANNTSEPIPTFSDKRAREGSSSQVTRIVENDISPVGSAGSGSLATGGNGGAAGYENSRGGGAGANAQAGSGGASGSGGDRGPMGAGGAAGMPAGTLANVLFATGFETGDPAPAWVDTLDNSHAVTGLMANLSSQCGIRTGEQAHKGISALLFSGTAQSATSSDPVLAYYKVFPTNMVISAESKLEYWLYPEQDNGRYGGVDLHCTDGTTLSGSGAVDQNGRSMDPSAGHGGVIVLNTWSTIKSNIGQWLAGKTVDLIWVVYSRPGSKGPYSGYIDDTVISNGTLP